MVRRSALLLCGLALMGSSTFAAGSKAKKEEKSPVNMFLEKSKRILDNEVADDFLRFLQIWTLDSKNAQVIQGVNGLAGLNKALHTLGSVFPKGVTSEVKNLDGKGENRAIRTIYDLQGAFTIVSDVNCCKKAPGLASINKPITQDEKLKMTLPGVLGILSEPLSETFGENGHVKTAVAVAMGGIFLKGVQRYMLWKKQQERLALLAEANTNAAA